MHVQTNNVTEAPQKTSSSAFSLWLGFALAGLLYGGLHCAGWFATFASRAEAILWRLSAASVVLTPIIWLPFLIFALNPDLNDELFARASRKDQRDIQSGAFSKIGGDRDPKTSWRGFLRKAKTAVISSLRRSFMVFVMVLGLASPPIWACYVFGRVFLVVECFLNLSHLPPEAFKTVEWPGYVPHIA